MDVVVAARAALAPVVGTARRAVTFWESVWEFCTVVVAARFARCTVARAFAARDAFVVPSVVVRVVTPRVFVPARPDATLAPPAAIARDAVRVVVFRGLIDAGFTTGAGAVVSGSTAVSSTASTTSSSTTSPSAYSITSS